MDYRNQEYIVIITETKSNDGRNIPLLVPTDDFVKKSFIKPNTYLGTRDDIGEKEYFDMKIDKKDLCKQELIKKRRIKFLKHYKSKYKKAHKNGRRFKRKSRRDINPSGMTRDY